MASQGYLVHNHHAGAVSAGYGNPASSLFVGYALFGGYRPVIGAPSW
jgi:hypothetical protein